MKERDAWRRAQSAEREERQAVNSHNPSPFTVYRLPVTYFDAMRYAPCALHYNSWLLWSYLKII